MNYITIDGDDVGHKITSAYLRNNVDDLVAVNNLVQDRTRKIAAYLKSQGFEIIFCAADGVAGATKLEFDAGYIYSQIKLISDGDLSFSAGVGKSLREAYVALLSAKSSGKGKLQCFEGVR
ncbi:mCpol domain-containing protein [Halopseudomonas pachastrellae]|nr:mCpol domain-containing protein [Halopseudomonas pachastrellae]WVM94127.1 mCpol domain-containing protein [Halopseudomonas pachastrellae]